MALTDVILRHLLGGTEENRDRIACVPAENKTRMLPSPQPVIQLCVRRKVTRLWPRSNTNITLRLLKYP
jgi:hypothetical protein